MSINLRVEEYCSECPYFEAEVTKFKSTGGRHQTLAETLVTCKHAIRCVNISDYLRKYYEENKEV